MKHNRVTQRGSEWFRMNTTDTQKMTLASAKYGLKLKGLQTVLDMFAGQNDYYYEVTEDTYETLELLYQCNDRAEIDELIQALIKAGEYDAEIYEQYHILTNERLQTGFVETGSHRVNSKRRANADYREPLYKELWLIELKTRDKYFEFISIENNELWNSSGTVTEQLPYRFDKRREEDRREEDRIEEDRTGEKSHLQRYTIEQIEEQRLSDKADTVLSLITSQITKLALQEDTYRLYKSDIRAIVIFFCKAYELYRGEDVQESFADNSKYICKQLVQPVSVEDTGEVLLSLDDDRELYKATIKKYFETDLNCDYSLTHFVTGNTRVYAVQDAKRDSIC